MHMRSCYLQNLQTCKANYPSCTAVSTARCMKTTIGSRCCCIAMANAGVPLPCCVDGKVPHT